MLELFIGWVGEDVWNGEKIIDASSQPVSVRLVQSAEERLPVIIKSQNKKKLKERKEKSKQYRGSCAQGWAGKFIFSLGEVGHGGVGPKI